MTTQEKTKYCCDAHRLFYWRLDRTLAQKQGRAVENETTRVVPN
ncbi:hypothetical protein [Candidatus Villigracilis saccharophilus]